MANHEVLLLKPVDGLGAEGDQVKVRAGYARNFLLPQGMAVPLTGANRKGVEALKKARGLREAKELDGAQALAKQIEKAVTANDIHEKLTAAGVTPEKRRKHHGQPIKTLGKHEVKIRLNPEVTVELSFDV